MTDERTEHIQHDEDATGRLLRLAGRRPVVPPERFERVRTVVHGHWQVRLRRRRLWRRSLGGAAMLTAAALLVLAVRMKAPRPVVLAPAAEPIATVDRVEGRALRGDGAPPAAAVIATGDAVLAGEWLTTTADGRVALMLRSSAALRLDRDSRARVVSPGVIELATGTVYLDNGDTSGFAVHTPLGIARDVGTQFEVHVAASTLRLRVRRGMVILEHGARSDVAEAGTEVTVAGAVVERRRFRADGPEWSWVTGLSREFPIEGRSLAAFLEHLSREQGWQLSYADAAVGEDARQIVLHGSVRGLTARDALAVAMATTSLEYSLEGGILRVFRSPQTAVE